MGWRARIAAVVALALATGCERPAPHQSAWTPTHEAAFDSTRTAVNDQLTLVRNEPRDSKPWWVGHWRDGVRGLDGSRWLSIAPSGAFYAQQSGCLIAATGSGHLGACSESELKLEFETPSLDGGIVRECVWRYEKSGIDVLVTDSEWIRCANMANRDARFCPPRWLARLEDVPARTSNPLEIAWDQADIPPSMRARFLAKPIKAELRDLEASTLLYEDPSGPTWPWTNVSRSYRTHAHIGVGRSAGVLPDMEFQALLTEVPAEFATYRNPPWTFRVLEVDDYSARGVIDYAVESWERNFVPVDGQRVATAW